MTIFATHFDPSTEQRAIVGVSEDSGFDTLDDVVMLMGEPVARGIRYVAYEDVYYSDYSLYPEVKI